LILLYNSSFDGRIGKEHVPSLDLQLKKEVILVLLPPPMPSTVLLLNTAIKYMI
jgi:hypothetical protein